MKQFESLEDVLLEIAELIKEDLLNVLPIPEGISKPFIAVKHDCLYLAGYINDSEALVNPPLWEAEHGADGLSDMLYEELGEEKYEEFKAACPELENLMENYLT